MIKERVIQLLEFKAIAKEKFYEKIGITSANFRGNAKKTPLNSNAIENILSEIPDLNLEWLITGKGSMVKSDEKSNLNQILTGNSNIQSGNNTSVTGDCQEKIKKLESKLQKCKLKLEKSEENYNKFFDYVTSNKKDEPKDNRKQ